MSDFTSNKYTVQEVTRIIRRALEMRREETVSHQDLLQTAEELGLDQDTLEKAIEEERTAVKRAAAEKERGRKRKDGFRRHLWGFAVVNTGLFLINVFTPGPWWFQWPLLGWSIGLAFSYRAAYHPMSAGHRNRI